MRLPALLALLLFTVSSLAAMTDDEARVAFDRANALHRAGDYEEACEIYEELLSVAPDDPVLLFNLGLTKQRLGEPGWAIWAYELALRERPGWQAARQNLDHLLPPSAQGSVLGWPLRWARERVEPGIWSWVAAWAWALALLAISLALLRPQGAGRRLLWRLTGLGGLIMVLSLVVLQQQHAERGEHPPCIVTAFSSEVRTAPDPLGGSPLGELEAGERVWLIGAPNDEGWAKVRTDSGQVGYLDSDTVCPLTPRRELP